VGIKGLIYSSLLLPMRCVLALIHHARENSISWDLNMHGICIPMYSTCLYTVCLHMYSNIHTSLCAPVRPSVCACIRGVHPCVRVCVPAAIYMSVRPCVVVATCSDQICLHGCLRSPLWAKFTCTRNAHACETRISAAQRAQVHRSNKNAHAGCQAAICSKLNFACMGDRALTPVGRVYLHTKRARV
jgi:hypothetical protein